LLFAEKIYKFRSHSKDKTLKGVYPVMKKSFFLFFMTFVVYFSANGFAQEIKVNLNGHPLNFDPSPIVQDGRTLVPFRSLFEKLGAEVIWDESKRTAIGYTDGIMIELTIDSNIAKVNGIQIALDVPARIIHDRVFVPLRFVSTNLNLRVGWAKDTKTVILKDENVVEDGPDLFTFQSDPITEDSAPYDSADLIYESSNTENPSIEPMLFVDTSSTYTLEKMHADIEQLVSHYPHILQEETIGFSVDGLPIKSIKLGLPQNEHKPNILLMGGIHARENLSVILVMKQIDVFLYHYFTDGTFGHYDLHTILENVNLYFVPTLNPDGMNIIHNGILASKNSNHLIKMKNLTNDSRWWKANANGVDLNKNFDDGNWHKSISALMSSVPASEGFKGYSPNSEPETIAIQKYCREKNFLLAFSYHTSGEVFFWADTDTHPQFEGIDVDLINRLHRLSGYSIMPVSKNPVAFGRGFENWFKKEFNRFAVCVELAPMPSNSYIQHPDSRFDELVWEKAKYLGIQLALEAINLEYYDVYQFDTFLKSFYSEKKAIEYAKLWEFSTVRKDGNTIWEF
jgi:g-D-glutamyl-meso-diaminopimelate peptidase